MPKKLCKIFNLLLQSIITTILAALILLIGFCFALQDEGFRIWLLTKSLPIISNKYDYQIAFLIPKSKTLQSWQFKEIEIKKNNQPYLKAQNLEFEYDLIELFYKKIIINNFKAKKISINLDFFNKEQVNKNFKLNGGQKINQISVEEPLKSYIEGIAVKFFQINILEIKNPIIEQKYFLSGSFAFLSTKFPLIINLKAKSLAKPAFIAEISSKPKDENSLEIDGVLNVQNNSIKLNGLIQENKIDLSVKINQLPIELIAAWFGYDLKGKITSEIKISNNFQNPKIEGNFVSNINFQNLPIKIDGIAKYQNKQMSVNLNSDLNLKIFNQFFKAGEQEISGISKFKMKISGKVSEPQINGELKIVNGHYKNLSNGLIINDCQSQINLKNDQVEIIKFDANDGKKGKILLSGQVNLKKELVNLNLKLQQAQIINRPEINSKADGNLVLNGGFKTLNLSGEIILEPLTIMLKKFWSKQINVLEINEDTNKIIVKNKQSNDKNFLPKVNLNIKLSLKDQAYLVAKSLSAKLQGQIKVYGEIKNPKYSGNFQTVKGKYNLLGKNFVLQEGKLEFINNSFQFIIPASYSSKNLEIIARIYGNNKDFQIDLSSNPTMDVNDIISNILFNKSSISINPLQAVLLAKTINDITNPNDSSFDPVSTVKNILKVDNLEFGSEVNDGKKSINVGAGKYLTENIYIEFKKSTDPSQLIQGNIKVEINNNLNLNSSISSENLENIGIEWKKDY